MKRFPVLLRRCQLLLKRSPGAAQPAFDRALAQARNPRDFGISHLLSVEQADEQLLHPLQRLVERETIPCCSDKKTRIVKAQLGNQAGIIGAALLGKKKRI